MTDTLRNQWSIPSWSADWQVWQNRFAETMNDIDSTVFANTEGLKFVFKQLPNARVIDDAGTKKLQMTSELKLISRTLNITVNIDYSTDLTLIPGYMICATVTPGAVGEQTTQFELYGSVPVDPSIRVFGYITDSYSINWYNGSVLGLGESYRQIFSFLASAGSDTEKVRASTADTTAGFLDTKVVAGDGITITTLNPGGNESLEISADNKVKVTASDTTEDYLYPSLVAGSNVTLTVLNPGGNEQIQIDASVSGTDTYKVKVSATDTTEDYLYASLVAGRDISFTILNSGSNETIRVDNALLTNNQIVYGSSGGLMDQSSSLTWDDTTLYVDGSITLNNNYITGATYIDWVANGVTTAERRQFWDDDDGYMVIGMKGGNVNLQVGGEELVRGRNDTGGTIDNGVGIMIDGGTGSTPIFGVSDITLGVDCAYIGIATEDISDNNFGYGNTSGLVRGETAQPIDTSSYSAGDRLWQDTGGTFTDTQPAAGNASISMGYVIRSHASEGVILHSPYCIPFLSYLSDVNARGNTHDDGAILSWDDGNGYWDLNTAVFSLDHDSTERTGNVELYSGSGIVIDDATGGYTISALIGDIKYTASSSSISPGTYISGNVSNTFTIDKVGLVGQEVTGSPGIVFTFGYEDVESFDRIQLHVLYSATSSSHTVGVQIYNYDTTSWVEFTTFGISVGYQIIDIPIEFDSGYVNVDGDAQLRLYHGDSGITSHQITVDYAVLIKSGGASGGGTLDDAYDYGGAGSGNFITADSNPVTITVPSGVNSRGLQLNNSHTTGTYELLSLVNQSSSASAKTIDMNGAAGTNDFSADGHVIASTGATKYTSSYDAGENTYVWQRAVDSEGADFPVVELYAQRGSGSAWSKIEVETADGESVTLSTSGTVNLSPDGSVYIDPGNGNIYCNDNRLREVQYMSYGAKDGASFATNTLTLDLENAFGFIEIGLTDDCTAVTISSDPIGFVEMDLFVFAVSVDRDLGGFPGTWNWQGEYNLSTGSVTIPGGDVGVIRIWRSSNLGYTAYFTLQDDSGGSIPTLNDQQVLFGNSSGGISQDSDFYWDGTDLYALNADIWADSLQKDITSTTSSNYVYMKATIDSNDHALVAAGYYYAPLNGYGGDDARVFLSSYATTNDVASILIESEKDGGGNSYIHLRNTSSAGNMDLFADNTITVSCDSVDLDNSGLIGLRFTEYDSVQSVSASASAAAIGFTSYDFVDLDLNNQSSVTITLGQPTSGNWSRKTMLCTQGGSTATTSFTWETTGAANVYWDGGTEPSWPTGTSDEFWVVFMWDGTNFHGIGTGAMS